MIFNNDITAYFARLKSTIDAVSVESVNELMNVLDQARQEERNVFIMGNGGSAATASHFVCDFNKGMMHEGKKHFKFICLNDNIPTMMAYANDLSWDDIFVGPLQNYFRAGDLVIGISGSGNSMNVVKALDWANQNGGVTIALTGYDGGKLLKMAKYNVHVPVDDMQITEDLHMVLDHCMMKIFCKH